VANAVSDALAIEINELPVSLEVAVEALRRAGDGTDKRRSTT